MHVKFIQCGFVVVSVCSVLAMMSYDGHIANSADPETRKAKKILNPTVGPSGWGYVDNQGNRVIESHFSWAQDFFEDRAAVLMAGKGGYIRPDGSWAVVLKAGAFPARRFSEGRAWYCDDGKYGCVDSDGNIVIPPTYSWAKDFSEGLAAVSTGGRRNDDADKDEPSRSGFVDRSGRIVIPLKYVDAHPYREGLAAVLRDDAQYEYIDRTGRSVFVLDKLVRDKRNYVRMAGEFCNGRAPVWFDGNGPGVPSGGFIDIKGNLVGGLTFERAWTFSEGLAGVRIDGKIGFVDRDLQMVIPPRFDEAGSFREGLCLVTTGINLSYIDNKGDVVAESRDKSQIWNDAEHFHAGVARVHFGGEFEERSRHGPYVWKGGSWHYIDTRGRIVALCRPDGERRPYVYFGKELPGTGY